MVDERGYQGKSGVVPPELGKEYLSLHFSNIPGKSVSQAATGEEPLIPTESREDLIVDMSDSDEEECC